MIKTPIKRNQIWKHSASDFQILVAGKKGRKWNCKVLTERPGVFNGSHTMSQITIWKKFELQ